MGKRLTNPLVLVDGTSFLHRAYHALPALTNAQGEPTGAIYGVVNMLRKLIADYQPQQLVAVFDAKGKNFRHQLYEDYKANRAPMPDELRVQLEPLYEIIRSLGIAVVSITGVEADDVIGTLTKQATAHDQQVLIATNDKDMAQLVNDDVHLIDTMNNAYGDTAAIVAKFGIKPEQIIDYLTLVGDSSDNVPGVPKVGPKTAVKWLQEYGDLENIIAHADKISGKVGENLRASLQQLPLTKQLVTIKTDVELNLSAQDMQRKNPDNAKLRELFQRLGFRRWLSNFEQKKPSDIITANYHTVLDEKDFAALLEKLTAAECFAFDTETTSLDTINAKLVGVSFALQTKEAFYIPLGHDYVGAPQQLSLDAVIEKLKPLFANQKIAKVGQNLKYDIEVLTNYDVEVRGQLYDTMLESYVLNSVGNRHNLETLALRYLDVQVTKYEDLVGKGKRQLNYSEVNIEDATNYAAQDADLALQLHLVLWPQLQQAELTKVYFDIEAPLINVLAAIERTGVCIDVELLAEQSQRLAERTKALENESYKIAGGVFNLNSPLQLQEVLYSKLKLPILKKTPKGQPSTAEPVLQELALDYPLPKLILEYRSLTKLQSTYVDALPLAVNAKTKRIHTSYNQAITATGRLSSSEPNLQNIPIRTSEGRKVRQAFIAAPGYKIVAADYSQIELRIMAHLSRDNNLIKAFSEDEDIHRATASEVFGVALTEVTTTQRRHAKAINFGLIYGMSAFGLAKQLKTSREQAQEFIDTYFKRYPGVKKYMQQTRETASQQAYVTTIFGRRLYTPEINASNVMRRNAAERAAINAPMQGSAADIIKLAMINIYALLQQSSLQAKMLMQVHDELVFEVAAADVDSAVTAIKQQMVSAAKLSVPIIVDVGVGDNWDEAH